MHLTNSQGAIKEGWMARCSPCAPGFSRKQYVRIKDVILLLLLLPLLIFLLLLLLLQLLFNILMLLSY